MSKIFYLQKWTEVYKALRNLENKSDINMKTRDVNTGEKKENSIVHFMSSLIKNFGIDNAKKVLENARIVTITCEESSEDEEKTKEIPTFRAKLKLRRPNEEQLQKNKEDCRVTRESMDSGVLEDSKEVEKKKGETSWYRTEEGEVYKVKVEEETTEDMWEMEDTEDCSVFSNLAEIFRSSSSMMTLSRSSSASWYAAKPTGTSSPNPPSLVVDNDVSESSLNFIEDDQNANKLDNLIK